MLMEPQLSQQHAGLQQVFQPQQEEIMPKARFKHKMYPHSNDFYVDH